MKYLTIDLHNVLDKIAKRYNHTAWFTTSFGWNPIDSRESAHHTCNICNEKFMNIKDHGLSHLQGLLCFI